MAPQQKQQKQPQDAYAQRVKTLTSAVQRLRGWVGSDPSRLPELADALVELTAHRLLGHFYGVAAADAQEAVRHAAQLLTVNGPIGPYTAVADAVRVVTAVVQVAAIQAGAGLPEAAGRTVESVADLQQQLSELPLAEQLKPQTVIWALSATARSALATGDPATANAYADAAAARLDESGLRADEAAVYLVLDVHRLLSDTRWAADRAEESLTQLHVAKDTYDALLAGRLREPGRLSPAVLERLAEPLFGLYRDLADRLAATGETDLGLVTRRELVDILQGLTKRLGEPARVQLASAWADLATDLLAVDRAAEAEDAAVRAAGLVLDSPTATAHPAVAAVRARSLTRVGRSAEAVALLRRVLPETPSSAPSAGQLAALGALADALVAQGEVEAADTARRAYLDAARELLGGAATGEPDDRLVQDLARGVISRGTGRLSWEPLDDTAAYTVTTAALAGTDPSATAPDDDELRRSTASWLESERAEAHQRELERRQQATAEAERRAAEQAQAERAEAERRDAERAEAERAERLEAARRAAAEEAERQAVKQRREERLEAHRLEVERQEAERREAERTQAERQAAARLADDPAEAEQVELLRMQAQLAELERREEETRAAAAAVEAELAQAAQAEAARAEGERAEAERAEAARVQAEQAAAERAAAERERAERADAERAAAEQAQAERAAAERAQAERAAAERARAEQAAAERAAIERDADAGQPVAPLTDEAPQTSAAPADVQREEPDELSRAVDEWRDMQARGDRRAARAANERVVELLRPRAEADLDRYGAQLLNALEELASARRRAGDLWGSRAPAREAKALARTMES